MINFLFCSFPQAAPSPAGSTGVAKSESSDSVFSVGSGSAVSVSGGGGGHARRSSESGVFTLPSPPSSTFAAAAIPATTNFSYGSQVYLVHD